MEKQITIRMPKESLEKWLTALESGKYAQGFGALESDGGYCCLGVLEHCLTGDVEHVYVGTAEQCPAGLPSAGWLESHKITFGRRFRNKISDIDEIKFHDDLAGPFTSPYLPKLQFTAHEANDENYTFAEIAAAIRECSEPNDE